jgi:hypothetical protein
LLFSLSLFSYKSNAVFTTGTQFSDSFYWLASRYRGPLEKANKFIDIVGLVDFSIQDWEEMQPLVIFLFLVIVAVSHQQYHPHIVMVMRPRMSPIISHPDEFRNHLNYRYYGDKLFNPVRWPVFVLSPKVNFILNVIPWFALNSPLNIIAIWNESRFQQVRPNPSEGKKLLISWWCNHIRIRRRGAAGANNTTRSTISAQHFTSEIDSNYSHFHYYVDLHVSHGLYLRSSSQFSTGGACRHSKLSPQKRIRVRWSSAVLHRPHRSPSVSL